jgi:uncharacterized protein (TIGR00730 family)
MTSASTPNSRSLCVYCGSGHGTDPAFKAASIALGEAFAQHKIRLVYGGGNVGLMGTIARTVIDKGGLVTGIIPEFLKAREIMFSDADETIVVPDMHTRKMLMFEKSDGFIALPGGVGTLEELVEQLTWSQLGRHNKPVMLANINGFWDPLITLFEHMRDFEFIRKEFEVTYKTYNSVDALIDGALHYFATRDAAAAAPSLQGKF